MPLLPCECVQPGNMPLTEILSNIYCADVAIYEGGGGGGGLPDQTGHAGEFLTTNGVDASWAAIPGGGDVLAGGTLTNNTIIIGNGGTTVNSTPTAAGVLTFLGTPSSANLAAMVTGETGSGALVFATSPTLVTPVLGDATATSINGLTITSTTTAALTLASGSSLIRAGAHALTLTTTGLTNVTLPTSGTLLANGGAASFTTLAASGAVTFTANTASSNTTTGTLVVTGGVGISGAVNIGGNVVGNQFSGNYFIAGASFGFYWMGRTLMTSPSDGVMTISNNALTDFGRLQFGGTTSSFPSLKRVSAGLEVRLADDSAGAALTALSLLPSTTTFALVNTTATTVNFAGAATALNVGASAAMVLNFGGATTAAQFRFLEPSASGTNYSGFRAQAQGASIDYILPATIGTTGQVLSITTSGSTGTLSWETASGSGDVTAASNFGTNESLIVADGTSKGVKSVPAVTVNSSGDLTTSGTLSTGSATVTALLPVSNDGAALGSGAASFSDLFLASGALINFANGNWTATHSSGILTVGTSMDLRMTTAGTNAASVVTVGGSQVLTNKTLTSPTMTAPVLGTPASGNLSSCTADGTNAVGYRNVPPNPKTGSYTLLASDVGKVIPNTTGGWTVNNSVHAAGDVIMVYNDSGSSQNITAGTITTMRLAGTASTGTRALAQRGIATLYFQSASEVVVSGSGVT